MGVASVVMLVSCWAWRIRWMKNAVDSGSMAVPALSPAVAVEALREWRRALLRLRSW